MPGWGSRSAGSPAGRVAMYNQATVSWTLNALVSEQCSLWSVGLKRIHWEAERLSVFPWRSLGGRRSAERDPAWSMDALARGRLEWSKLPCKRSVNPELPPPERFDGSTGQCQSFPTPSQLVFSLQPQTFPTDSARVACIITQLTGKSKKWGTAALSAKFLCTLTSNCFMQEMHRVFDRSSTGMDSGQGQMRLRQGKNSVSDYAIEFQTMVTDSGWKGRAIIDAFLHRLLVQVKGAIDQRPPWLVGAGGAPWQSASRHGCRIANDWSSPSHHLASTADDPPVFNPTPRPASCPTGYHHLRGRAGGHDGRSVTVDTPGLWQTGEDLVKPLLGQLGIFCRKLCSKRGIAH